MGVKNFWDFISDYFEPQFEARKAEALLVGNIGCELVFYGEFVYLYINIYYIVCMVASGYYILF